MVFFKTKFVWIFHSVKSLTYTVNKATSSLKLKNTFHAWFKQFFINNTEPLLNIWSEWISDPSLDLIVFLCEKSFMGWSVANKCFVNEFR